jgi:hypothetical protein
MIKSGKMRWAGNVTRMGEGEENAYGVLAGKPEVERPLGRHRRRWKNNTKLDLREIRWGSMDWTTLAQDKDQWRALVNTVMNSLVP